VDRFLPELSAVDWAFIASVIILASLLVFGTYAIRSEVREAKRVEAKSVKLKTSKVQRQQLRKRATSAEMVNLLDDIEALLRFINADDVLVRQEHSEAVRLSWMSYRVPVRAVLFGGFVLAGVFSAILMMIAQGPSNPIP
jgi:hypothetical protein